MSRIIAAGLSDVGRERASNQDAFHVGSNLILVADGMGGHLAGEVASKLAIDTMVARYGDSAPRRSHEAFMRTAMADSHHAITVEACDPAKRGMGTTIVALSFGHLARVAYLGHVGDSRCYRLRGGRLDLLTVDHTAIGFGPHVLARCLGAQTHARSTSDITRIDVKTGDRYLLCSDGLHGMIDDVRIAEILDSESSPSDACRALVDAANQAGGNDNITAVVAMVQKG